MNYYLGLDNGGTTTKAAIYSELGKELVVASQETKAVFPKPGYVERDMEEMWQTNCQIIRSALKRSGLNAGDIRAVAVCGHGKGLYLWGKNGRPARPGIISTDNRAYHYPIIWRAQGIESSLFPITCQHILACQPVSLLAWLRDYEPEIIECTDWIFSAKDYIRFRLTGKAQAELTDCSGNGLLNLWTRDYDSRIMEQLGIQCFQSALPPLCGSMDICGAVSASAAAACGLAEGTPVIGGMFDIDSCALAANITNEDNICIIAGTWSINEYLRSSPVIDGSVQMNSLFAVPDYYLIEESSPTSAGNSEWFIQTFLPELSLACKEQGKNIYEIMNQWVGDIPAQDQCPIFLPFLMASNTHPNAKGCLIGIRQHHTRAHIARSIYEGITFAHRFHFEKLIRSRQAPPKRIRLAGGAAHSSVWAQMFADIMGFPVETISAQETGTLGCAIAAAAAVGPYANIADAAAQMSQITHVYLPSMEKHAVYQKKYNLYCKSIDVLKVLWDTDQAQEERF